MAARVVLPLSRVEMAVAEIGELLAHGREPEEIARLGWPNLAEIMQQRRELVEQGSQE